MWSPSAEPNQRTSLPRRALARISRTYDPSISLQGTMPAPSLYVPAPTLDVVSWLVMTGRHGRVLLFPLFPGRSRDLVRMQTESANRIRDMPKRGSP